MKYSLDYLILGFIFQNIFFMIILFADVTLDLVSKICILIVPYIIWGIEVGKKHSRRRK